MVGYVDQSGLIKADLPGYEGQFVAYADESQARAALLAKEINSYFVLPADYVQSGTVLVYGTGGGFSSFVAADTEVLPKFLVDQLLAGRVDPAIQTRARTPANIVPVTLNDKGEVDTESAFSWLGDFVVPYLFSILFIMTIFTTSGFLLQGVSTEKEGRIIEVLLSSISPTQLLTGKILGLGALGLGQMLFWLGSAAALLSATVAIFAMVGVIKLSLATIVLAVVYFMLGYLLFATLMAVAGSMGTSMRESQQISGIFSIGAALPYIALNLVFTNPDSPILLALSYFPADIAGDDADPAGVWPGSGRPGGDQPGLAGGRAGLKSVGRGQGVPGGAVDVRQAPGSEGPGARLQAGVTIGGEMDEQSGIKQDERVLAALAHGSVLLGPLTNGVGGIVTALVIWLIKRDKSAICGFSGAAGAGLPGGDLCHHRVGDMLLDGDVDADVDAGHGSQPGGVPGRTASGDVDRPRSGDHPAGRVRQ